MAMLSAKQHNLVMKKLHDKLVAPGVSTKKGANRLHEKNDHDFKRHGT